MHSVLTETMDALPLAQGIQPALLEARGLFKSYGPVQAVKGIDVILRPGEVLALCGENGAGKSTVFKILAGDVLADQGKMTIAGRPYQPANALEAVQAGVSMVYQEFNILPQMSVAENIFLGRTGPFQRGGLIRWDRLYAAAAAELEAIGLSIDPRALMSGLTPSRQKMVELARALATRPKVLLLDEITASLDHDDAEALVTVMQNLQSQGVAIVCVSHRLQEIFRSCTTIEVMKDGDFVTTLPAAELDEERLSALMVGRDLGGWQRSARLAPGSVSLELEHFSGEGFREISLQVRKGQLVSLVGLAGSGADEVLEAIFGARPASGLMRLDGEEMRPASIPDAIRAGIAMVPKERATEGLIDALEIGFNMTLASLGRFGKAFGRIDNAKLRSAAAEGITTFSVKAASAQVPVQAMSGGNKQKVLLAKWFATDPRLLLLNNPTRGVDIGVKFEIYDLLQKLQQEKDLTVLIASEDMAEVIRLSDVVYTIRHGEISGRFEGEAITETNLITAML